MPTPSISSATPFASLLLALLVFSVTAEESGLRAAPTTPRGIASFIRDFIHHYNFNSVNIFTTLPEKERLALLFPQTTRVRFGKLTSEAARTQEFPLPAYKLLSVVMVDPAEWHLIDNVLESQETMMLVFGEHSRGFGVIHLPLDNKILFAEPRDRSGRIVSVYTPGGLESVQHVDLVDVYKVGPGVMPRVQLVGHWEDLGGGTTDLQAPSAEVSGRRWDLMGLHLDCLTNEWPPATISRRLDSGVVEVNGWIGEVWRILQERMNFTSTCRHTPDNEWGTLRNGTWSGMVGELVGNRADVIMAPLDFNLERSRVIDFALPIESVKYIMVKRRENQQAGAWRSYTQEFGTWSWASVLIFLVVSPCVLSFVAKTSPLESTKVTLVDAVTCTLGSLGLQGSSLQFNSASSRILLLASFLTSVLLYSHYTSALFSALAVTTSSQPFQDLQGILENGKYRFGFLEGISVENAFKERKNLLHRAVWDRLVSPVPSGLMETDADGLARVLKEKYVYMMDKTSFLYITRGQCEFERLPSIVFSFQSGLAFRKNSSFTKVFSKAILNVLDSGITKKLIMKWQRKPDKCGRTFEVEPFTLNQVFTAFLFLGIGIVASLCILAVEVLVWHVRGTSKEALYSSQAHAAPADQKLNVMGVRVRRGSDDWFLMTNGNTRRKISGLKKRF